MSHGATFHKRTIGNNGHYDIYYHTCRGVCVISNTIVLVKLRQSSLGIVNYATELNSVQDF